MPFEAAKRELRLVSSLTTELDAEEVIRQTN
jgi:hypothetical protein